MPNARHLNAREWMRAVLERYEGPLVRYAARITGDLERGRDVAQETFLRLWRFSGEVGADHLAQWLFTVCRNRALDVRRKEGRMRRLTDRAAAGVVGREPGPLALIERHEAAQAALEALASLPDNQQEVIRLRLQEGFSYRQISGITGLTVSNVGFLIHVGMKRIREQLRAWGLAPGGVGRAADGD